MTDTEAVSTRLSDRKKVTLITGASSGIGAGLAIRRAKRGEDLILLARRAEKLEVLATEVRAFGVGVEVVAVDVADRNALESALDKACDKLGPIDLLIANAGLGIPTPAKRFDAADFERVVSVNLVGAANCIAYVLPSMLARNCGQLVGIASLAAYRGLPKTGAYCASKAGLLALFESLRIDLLKKSIAVTTICPGYIKTPMTDKNKFSMPFIMELEPALDKIERAIDAGWSEYAFPFTLATIVRIARWVPNSLYDKFMKGKG